jgi:hypothetical protein
MVSGHLLGVDWTSWPALLYLSYPCDVRFTSEKPITLSPWWLHFIPSAVRTWLLGREQGLKRRETGSHVFDGSVMVTSIVVSLSLIYGFGVYAGRELR